MPLPASQLNRKAIFRRRALMPATAGTLRDGFDTETRLWANLKVGSPSRVNVGSFDMQGQNAIISVRDSAFSRSVTEAYRVEVEGHTYEIQSIARADGMIRMAVTTARTMTLYDREFELRGEAVTVRRVVPNADPITIPARAIVTGYQPSELVGGINQGERKVLLSAADLENNGFPVPPRVNDRIIVRGRALNVLSVDDSTHREAGILAAYELRVSGG